MKNKIYKDKNKRKLSLKNETRLIVLKSIYKTSTVPKSVRWNTGLCFESYIRTYPSSNVNRCILTGRKKKIASSFKLSRLSFLKFARNGYI
jgi:ribosomal protein S14